MDHDYGGLFVRLCNLMLVILALDELKERNQCLIMVKNAILSY